MISDVFDMTNISPEEEEQGSEATLVKRFEVTLPLTIEDMRQIKTTLTSEDGFEEWVLGNMLDEGGLWELTFTRTETVSERHKRYRKQMEVHVNRVKQAHSLLLTSKKWLEEHGFSSEYAHALIESSK